ncbi:MAG: AAA domain-containing protein [Acidobacteria bacterium]|nr:AAA domain-containing protein [Acidobacteriota bacterium]MYJ04732.1 AAA domain-containing protein [Acidobacteriota bacterium]
MREIYDWARWFRELTERIAEGGETSLFEKAKQVDWNGEPELLKHGDRGIDPFSFIYTLAQKNTRYQRPRVYPSVTACFELTAPLPDLENDDLYLFPVPPAVAIAVFHDSRNFSPELLWRLFGQAITDEPRIDPTTFREVLKIKFVAQVKLTHALYLINPNYFVPVDALQLVPANKDTNLKGCDYDGFMAALNNAKRTFPGCRGCELNTFLYSHYMSTSPLLKPESRFFQISTNAYGSDRWEDFDRSNAVYTDSSRQAGDTGLWETAAAGSDGRGAPYPLTEPSRGDVILVRTGVRKGRAIGIVHRNDYAETDGLNEKSRLHVYWINKSEADFVPGTQTDRVAFSEVNPHLATYRAFRQATAYRPTFTLTDEAIRDRNGPVDPSTTHPLNQILYGPPGTGKTWHTVTRAVAIVEDLAVGAVTHEDRDSVKRRFDEHREAGRIEMVTFTQNTTYEDFVEGIRPVLVGSTSRGAAEPADNEDVGGDVRYELSRGVFRHIVDRAKQAPDQRYVLVIDEINRGNIARIFGELITLIEDSKRIGEDDEARVTLPGSKAEFGVPANLHVVGTMNTADRSIALLDTALRRRFVFVEMMPDPFHPGVSANADGVDCRKLLAAMNRRIAVLLDREHQIGHTYFLGVDKLPALASMFRTRIIPLLQEYFYDDWAKIRAVLNDNEFVQVSEPPEELVRRDLVDADRAVYSLLPDDDGRWISPTAYRAVYETKASAEDGIAAPSA